MKTFDLEDRSRGARAPNRIIRKRFEGRRPAPTTSAPGGFATKVERKRTAVPTSQDALADGCRCRAVRLCSSQLRDKVARLTKPSAFGRSPETPEGPSRFDDLLHRSKWHVRALWGGGGAPSFASVPWP
jgi:hypothetical protein